MQLACRIALFSALAAVVYPKDMPALRVSSDGRGLETSHGKPFVWVGDTAWFLFTNLDRSEADRYLRDRVRKRFTVIQAHLPGFAKTAVNAYGEAAFRSLEPPVLNDKYLEHAGWILERAESLGLRVLLIPVWAKEHIENKSPLLRNSAEAEQYGRQVAERFRARKNLMWCLGGDVRPSRHEIYDSLARGIQAGLGYDPLITYHPPGGTYRPPATSTGEFYHDKPWMDFNMIQSGHRRGNENYLRIAEDWARTPVKPTLDSEPCYERHPIRHDFNNGVFEAYDVRQRAWWSILAGGFGFTYGGNGIWQMAKPGRTGQKTHFNLYWYDALDLDGARQMRHVHEILERYPVRIPDASVLLTPPGAGDSRIQSARAEDGSYWLIYDTSGQGFKIKPPWASGKAAWFDPRSGRRTAAPWGGEFNPPGEPGVGNDWLLILERR